MLIIGGSHGIGYALVRRLLAQGATVTVVARTEGQLTDGDLPQTGSLLFVPADVTSHTLTEEQLPEQIDGFVYCPGSIQLGSIRSTKPAALRDGFELNVVAAMTCLQAALPALSRSPSASAVFFSTVAVTCGLPMHTAVAAVKGAVEALVRTWAAELAPRIRVNGIAPALTDTRLAERFLRTDAMRLAMAEKHPLGRIGTPQDVAAMAEFLLSEQSSWTTGQILAVDGGMSTLRS